MRISWPPWILVQRYPSFIISSVLFQALKEINMKNSKWKILLLIYNKYYTRHLRKQGTCEILTSSASFTMTTTTKQTTPSLSTTCLNGYCFFEHKKKSSNILYYFADKNKHNHEKLAVLLGAILGILILILFVLILINFKRHNKRQVQLLFNFDIPNFKTVIFQIINI